MRLVIFHLLPLTSHALNKACETWCFDSCAALNGDVRRECSGCESDGRYGCFPGAPGWDDARVRVAVNWDGGDKTLEPAASAASATWQSASEVTFQRPRHDGHTVHGRAIKCTALRISYEQLLSLSAEERRAVFKVPTVVTGLIDHWPALQNWTDPRAFSVRALSSQHGARLSASRHGIF